LDVGQDFFSFFGSKAFDLSGKVKHFSLPCDQFHLHAFAIVNDIHDKPPFSVFGLLLPAAGQLFSGLKMRHTWKSVKWHRSQTPNTLTR
jgi:hypothetical protein